MTFALSTLQVLGRSYFVELLGWRNVGVDEAAHHLYLLFKVTKLKFELE